MKIKAIRARWVLDSRGDPTIEVDVALRNGYLGRASMPSGAIENGTAARELRDGDNYFCGRGVSRALNIIEYAIAPALLSMPADHQEAIDAKLVSLDGTGDKHAFGTNTILAVSLATAKAVANAYHVPFYRYVAHLAGNNYHELRLPMPMANIINGGLHAPNTIDIQEMMIIPVGAKDVYSGVRMITEVFHALGLVLHEHGHGTSLGDEGGYALHGLKRNEQALEILSSAVRRAGYRIGVDIAFALDCAASRLYKNGQYNLSLENRHLGYRGMCEWYGSLLDTYPIVSIEDPFSENAWREWSDFKVKHGGITQIIADDLVSTNARRLHKAIEYKACNALSIKPNQIGTLTDTIHVVKSAQNSGIQTILSARSADTEDTSLVHLAVGLNSVQIKLGSVARGERTAKYNELLRIAESLKTDALTSMR